MSQLEIRPVNKYDSVWNPNTMFSGFKVRAVLIKSPDLITNIQNMAQLRKRLRRELGSEDVDWILDENPMTRENELYLQSSAKLVMWKLQDNQKFTELFSFVEQHTDDSDKITQWEVEQEEKRVAAEEAARLEREAKIQAMIDANRPPDQMPGTGFPTP